MSTDGSASSTNGDGGARRRVLVTGAAGRIGRGFAAATSSRFDLRLTDLPEADLAAVSGFGEVRPCRLDDVDELPAVFEGVHTVIHLAGQPHPDTPWDKLLPDNIVATYNVFAAAERAGCRRVVFASSIHAVGGYPRERRIHPADPVNPGNLYGVSKCFGEAVARYAAEQGTLSAVVVRIGAFQPFEAATGPDSAWLSDIWVAPPDLFQVLLLAVETPDIQFAVVHATSANDVQRLDLEDTRRLLGYQPEYGWTATAGGATRMHQDGPSQLA
ncbi:NAD-dependent epimerase/dehydratase family protein [Amycolatopsis sp. cmx-4-68]|uniref:NAD-dependent epimerase/dehydratase family protein n=1 Tax=Amycolatopsis sp. cmx-4-68 TaxID=2790938 RepID=UPI00397DA685